MSFLKPCVRRLLITLAVIALVALRKHHSLTQPQFWAEDGAVFFMDAENAPWGALFKPYEGYLHLLPRLIAAAGSALPVVVIPGFYAWAALAVTGLVGWTLQSPRIRLPAAWAGALAIGLIPHTGEVYLTICNLQWITAIGLFACVIADDAATRLQRIGELLYVAIVGLTGPFIVLALPLFAWRAWRRRSQWSFSLLALAAACTVAHLPFLFDRPSIANPAPWAPFNHIAVIGHRLICSLGTDGLNPGRMVCALLALAVPGWLAWFCGRHRIKLPGGRMLLIAIIATLAATAYKARVDTWAFGDLTAGDRYFFTAKVLLAWLLVATATIEGLVVRIAATTMAMVALALSARHFIYPPFPDLHWKESAAQIERGESTTVPILPDDHYFIHSGRHRSIPPPPF